jgi:hypothetical protein
VANKGFEVSLTTQNIDGRDFRWETNIVYAINRNKIVEIYGDGKDDIGNRWFIGKPINVIYDYKMTLAFGKQARMPPNKILAQNRAT